MGLPTELLDLKAFAGELDNDKVTARKVCTTINFKLISFYLCKQIAFVSNLISESPRLNS